MQLIARGLGDINLCDHRDAYKYFDSYEQMPPNFSMRISPKDILESLKASCIRERAFDEKDALYYQMFKLMVVKIGPQTTPELRSLIRERLTQGTEIG